MCLHTVTIKPWGRVQVLLIFIFLQRLGRWRKNVRASLFSEMRISEMCLTWCLGLNQYRLPSFIAEVLLWRHKSLLSAVASDSSHMFSWWDVYINSCDCQQIRLICNTHPSSRVWNIFTAQLALVCREFLSLLAFFPEVHLQFNLFCPAGQPERLSQPDGGPLGGREEQCHRGLGSRQRRSHRAQNQLCKYTWTHPCIIYIYI